jgi:hypothetical protein
VVVLILALVFARTLLRLLVLVAVVLAALAVAAELVVPPVVEDRIEAQVRAEVDGVGSVAADLAPPPVVARLGLLGQVGRLTVDLGDVRRSGLTLHRVGIRLDGVRLERQALWQRRVELRSIDAGSLTAELVEADLAAATGLPVRLAEGRAAVTVGGQEVVADVAVDDGALVLGRVRRLALPVDDLLPCPLDGRVVDGRLELTCRLDDVPPALVAALQRAVEGGGAGA